MPTMNNTDTTPFADRFALFSPFRFTLFSPGFEPVYLSPATTFSKVETVRGWREQAKAERDAGLEGREHQYAVLVQFFKCDLCRICIGRDYYEQELYLYPVFHQKERISDDPTYYDEPRFLHICGGCAARRLLPSTLRMIEPNHWLTTVLLVEEGEPTRETDPTSAIEKFRIRKALKRRIERYHHAYSPQALWQALQQGTTIEALPEELRTLKTRGAKDEFPTISPLLYFTSPLARALAESKQAQTLLSPRKEKTAI